MASFEFDTGNLVFGNTSVSGYVFQTTTDGILHVKREDEVPALLDIDGNIRTVTADTVDADIDASQVVTGTVDPARIQGAYSHMTSVPADVLTVPSISSNLVPTYGANDARRSFTWAWSGHNYIKGFSAGSSISSGFQYGSEGHAIQRVNVYVKLR